jgi:hypothetical protein
LKYLIDNTIKMNLEENINFSSIYIYFVHNVLAFMYYTSHLTNIPSNEHIMLLYASDDERNNAAVKYINNGLKSGHKCIYASINAYDSESSSNISNLSSKLIIIKKISKPENYKLLILSLIMNQHYMEIYLFLTS